MTVPIKLKSIYEPSSDLDGRRVLTTQYWPRGIRKGLVDEYIRKLAPSRELLHAFKGGKLDWEGYRVRYFEEVASAQAVVELKRLKELSARAIVTVMCVCRDEHRCHRSLLKALIEGDTPL